VAAPLPRERTPDTHQVYDAAGRPLVDIRGLRFAAAVTTAVLAAALTLRDSVGMALVLWQWAVFAFAVVAGLRYSLYGTLFRMYAHRFGAGPASAREPEAGPRFAQACGLAVLSIACVGFAAGADTVAWAAVAVVAGLSGLLAVTNICLGCRLYGLTRRLPILPQ
jgi:uncharacterized membrane protein YjgN (DUF898 family)